MEMDSAKHELIAIRGDGDLRCVGKEYLRFRNSGRTRAPPWKMEIGGKFRGLDIRACSWGEGTEDKRRS